MARLPNEAEFSAITLRPCSGISMELPTEQVCGSGQMACYPPNVSVGHVGLFVLTQLADSTLMAMCGTAQTEVSTQNSTSGGAACWRDLICNCGRSSA